MGGGYADGVNSGTNSVFVALKALNPEPFTEVIVGAVTDPGGIMPIAMLNCIPIVADTAPGSYNTGAEQVEACITDLTSAIIIPHIGGEPADIVGIMKVAAKYNLPVVEDCSQSHGAKINGQYVGTFGDIAAYSMMFGKHTCAGGQGGLVFTKNEDLYWSARRAADRGKLFGIKGTNGNVSASLNCNMDELGAAIGRVQLKKQKKIIAGRQAFVATLKAKGLDKLGAVEIPEIADNAEHSYWWWKLRVNADKLSCSKMEFLQAVMAEGVLLAPDYSAALPFTFDWFINRSVFGTSEMPWSSPQYKGNAPREFACPNAKATMASHFNLAVAESWGEAEAESIVAAFKKVEAVLLK
jgi:dTDP-4-amino-4,6-dideoxygalactose transaminase